MSEYEKKDNSGVLFKNSEQTKETDPDYKGNATVNGIDYFFNAWINTSKAGKKYMKTSFSAKEQVHNNGVQQVQAAVSGMSIEEMEDDIPF